MVSGRERGVVSGWGKAGALPVRVCVKVST